MATTQNEREEDYERERIKQEILTLKESNFQKWRYIQEVHKNNEYKPRTAATASENSNIHLNILKETKVAYENEIKVLKDHLSNANEGLALSVSSEKASISSLLKANENAKTSTSQLKELVETLKETLSHETSLLENYQEACKEHETLQDTFEQAAIETKEIMVEEGERDELSISNNLKNKCQDLKNANEKLNKILKKVLVHFPQSKNKVHISFKRLLLNLLKLAIESPSSPYLTIDYNIHCESHIETLVTHGLVVKNTHDNKKIKLVDFTK